MTARDISGEGVPRVGSIGGMGGGRGVRVEVGSEEEVLCC